MTFEEIKPILLNLEYMTCLGNLGDDFIEVTFFYTYWNKTTQSFHTVEVSNPDRCGRNEFFFEDFDNEIDRDDYDEGIEDTDAWFIPEEDDLLANWMAHLCWLGPSYEWPEYPELDTDDLDVVNSACSKLFKRIEDYKKEHGQ